ncbi:MAG: hypothetical protein KAS01_02725 [Candidatus Pacebacteria bacterium]|nr:hypothetical protein [Candidatus Paceibacterota bacterium]
MNISYTGILRKTPLDLRSQMNKGGILETPISAITNFVDQETKFWPTIANTELHVRTI